MDSLKNNLYGKQLNIELRGSSNCFLPIVFGEEVWKILVIVIPD